MFTNLSTGVCRYGFKSKNENDIIILLDNFYILYRTGCGLINEISFNVPMNLRVIFPKRTIGIWNFQKKSLSLIDEETQR